MTGEAAAGYCYKQLPMLFSVLATIFGLSLLIIVHEGGHYLAARFFGMRVTRFSIGFGPTLAKYQPKGSPTTFLVGAIPFMAYVMIDGMNPADEVDENNPELYSNKSVFARIVTIFAGPFANYLAASVMIFTLAVTTGWQEPVEPVEPMVVGEVSPDSPAMAAGLLPGDIILKAEGKAVANVQELIEVTAPRAGKATSYVVERGGKALPPMMITPRDMGGRGVIGVTPQRTFAFRVMPFAEAATLAIELPYRFTVFQLVAIRGLIEDRSTQGIVGPVGMGKMVAQQVEKGVFSFVFILITISVAVGLFNLLPFPALDGGRLMFLGYELVTRRRPNERFEATIHALGLLFLLGVVALVTLRDVVS